MLLAQINQETAAEAVKNCIAVLPIGATEVHGNHLPVGTDSFLAAGVARKLEERLAASGVWCCPAYLTDRSGRCARRRAPWIFRTRC